MQGNLQTVSDVDEVLLVVEKVSAVILCLSPEFKKNPCRKAIAKHAVAQKENDAYAADVIYTMMDGGYTFASRTDGWLGHLMKGKSLKS